MSYDLNFWRYRDEALDRGPRDHRDFYWKLCEGETPQELEPLPVEEIRARFAEAMSPGWTWDDFAWVRPGAVIEQYFGPCHVRLDLRGKWTGDDVNPLIEIMGAEFRCPLYDPQVGGFGERFGRPEQVVPGIVPKGPSA